MDGLEDFWVPVIFQGQNVNELASGIFQICGNFNIPNLNRVWYYLFNLHGLPHKKSDQNWTQTSFGDDCIVLGVRSKNGPIYSCSFFLLTFVDLTVINRPCGLWGGRCGIPTRDVSTFAEGHFSTGHRQPRDAVFGVGYFRMVKMISLSIFKESHLSQSIGDGPPTFIGECLYWIYSLYYLVLDHP